MVKMILFAVAVCTVSVTQAGQKCGVMGENPKNSGTYDVLIDFKEVDLTKGPYIYEGVSFWATASKTSSGLQVATTSKVEKNKLFALAVSPADKIFMIDGQNQVTVSCYQN